jgi:hypothetical protein
MLSSNTFLLRKKIPMKRGTIFKGENEQFPLGRRKLNWLGRLFFWRRRGLNCPKRQLRSMNKEFSPRSKGFCSRRKKQNGSTNHVPLNNNFLREKGINFFWGTISKGE